MTFDSFNIRRLTDNSIVNMVEVDKMVCDEFNLELLRHKEIFGENFCNIFSIFCIFALGFNGII